MTNTKRFVIRDREAGNEIDYFATFEEAKKQLELFEKNDIEEGIYEENFYEIFDSEKEEVIF